MARLGDLVEKVRSKNAGPFVLTIDIFCAEPEVYLTVVKVLKTEAVAKLFGTDTQLVKRFDMPELSVVKFSFPRPVVQGARADRDMHGASYGALLADLRI